MSVYLGILLFLIGQVVGWFSMNIQFLSEWWQSKPLLTAILMGTPTSICFWYAYKAIVTSTDSAWTARFIGSSTGLIVFPILTWYFLGESMFTTKTMLCFSLAVLIIMIQILY